MFGTTPKLTEKRAKGKNISEEQENILAEWDLKHPQLKTKKFSANFTLKDSQQLWENVTIFLNSCVGATKTWQLWRRCYNDIKWLTKGKVPSKASYNKTGGGDKPDGDYLSEIENTVVNMIGPTAVFTVMKVSWKQRHQYLI
ncbi:uncharacterized protein LOC132948137 [Metopolophium dirhodum]|uniref:uncharacterized protein LOC132948137 n=1 Tax=Metopolophium dirhodum TaxID=44670 RepID=UPI00298FDE35|nr:uncharacterized protein LOC132948137 [Metopolophium dirhodum]